MTQQESSIRARFSRELAPLRGRLVVLARRLCGRLDEGEDVLQGALVKAWQAYQSAGPIHSFGAWMARFVVHESLNQRRRNHKRAGETSGETSWEQIPVPDPAREIQTELAYEALAGRFERVLERLDATLLASVRALAPAERQVLLLKSILELNCREIAEVLEIPRGTVLSRLHRARLKVRARLLPAGTEGRDATRPLLEEQGL